jgi:hypothetical protein
MWLHVAAQTLARGCSEPHTLGTAEARTRDCSRDCSDPPLGVVLAEAVVEEEVCEGVVEVGPESHQTVSLVRIRDLPETLEALFKGTASEDCY